MTLNNRTLSMKPISISRFITALILLLLLLLSSQSYADQWYQVELVVFEQIDTVTDEQWPTMPDELMTGSLTPDMANTFIQPASNENLNNIAERLNRSPQYRVHYHQSWKQFIMRKGRAKAVNIISTDGMIEGTIRLDKATYLHASLDLWLKENTGLKNSWSDSSPQGTDLSGPRNPHLDESRRIRSKELYFFDHPKLGALLKLTPIKTPAAIQATLEPLETFSLPNEAASTASE